MASVSDLKGARAPSQPLSDVKVPGAAAARRGARSGPDSDTGLRSSLGANLARLRATRGWSLRELAARSGVSKALLSRIERGDGNPAVETLFRIGSALGCSVSELVSFETSEPQIVRAGEGERFVFADGKVVSRLLFANPGSARIEIYDCEIPSRTRSEFEGRAGFGVTEYALVSEGSVLIGSSGREELLGAHDAISFRHDTTNAFESLDEPVRVLCILAYDA